VKNNIIVKNNSTTRFEAKDYKALEQTTKSFEIQILKIDQNNLE